MVANPRRTLVRASSTVLWQVTLTLTASALPQSPCPIDNGGEWAGPYNWTDQLQTPFTCTQQEIVHGALIPTGPFAGKVLMFRREQRRVPAGSGPCQNTDTPKAYIFDPQAPSQLIEINQTLSSDIFCAGQSWDKFGHLVVAGGVPSGCGDSNPPLPRSRVPVPV